MLTYRDGRQFRLVVCVSLAYLLHSDSYNAVIADKILENTQETDSIIHPVFAIRDINPDKSDLDPVDPDGATGGRVNGLASVSGDNRRFYAASEWGGLYRSGDGGLTWSHLSGHTPVATWDIEVNPRHSSIVYATSFYDGRRIPQSGIQVSHDGGNTWRRVITRFHSAHTCDAERRSEPSAFGIAIDPAEPRRVYIGTNCGIAITRNAGITWTVIDPTPADPASDVWDVAVHDTGTVDICGDDGHLRSTDGGTTWTQSTGLLPGGRCSITVSPDEPDVLFVVVGTGLFESTDAGANWLSIPNPSAQGRIPFVTTNPRSGNGGRDFDLWFGDVSLHRRPCTTPAVPVVGGATRCPPLPEGSDGIDNDGDGVVDEPDEAWFGMGGGAGRGYTRAAGAHDDAGDLVFDTATTSDACPRIFSSDGGVYYNTDTSADCHNPDWEQPDVTPHALWLFAMDGAHHLGAEEEDLYFGNQDNGSFASTDAGAASPAWSNKDCCDVFDVAAHPDRVLYTVCCFGGRANRLFLRDRGMVGGGEINTYPPGTLPGFQYPDIIDRFAETAYVLVTTDGTFITADITANPITWTELGAASDPGACAVQAANLVGTTTFYVQVGCDPGSANQLWRYTGTDPNGQWQRIDTNLPGGGIGIFAVDPSNADRLYGSHIRATANPRMVFSKDGGVTWSRDRVLDRFMNGAGFFRYRTRRGPTDFTGFGAYPQPSLVAFDPEQPHVLVAGGRDSGVFASCNGGLTWNLLTDPFSSDTSGIPHLPRPWFAYFDRQAAGTLNVFVGTQGRGVWRIEGLCS